MSRRAAFPWAVVVLAAGLVSVAHARPLDPPSIPKRGAYYLDDGPADTIPPDLDKIPDAEPRVEPLHRFANNPYSVFGQDYTPLKQPVPFKQRGMASWYGRRFHGQRTSSGERYDMFAMTAAHPTLPIPSYVRVTHVASGRSVVVRINDRGPFHSSRVIDLSYTAAWKLGYADAGSALVAVESIAPEGSELARAPDETDPIEQLILNTERKAPPPIDLPTVTEPRGIFVQLAAFTSRDNAEAFRGHLARELGTLAGKLVLHTADGRHRLRMGPYSSALEARNAADRIREVLDVRPVVVTR